MASDAPQDTATPGTSGTSSIPSSSHVSSAAAIPPTRRSSAPADANAEYREWVVHLASQKAKSEERQKWRSLGRGKGEVESAVASIGVTEETEEDEDLSSSIPDDGEFLKFQ